MSLYPKVAVKPDPKWGGQRFHPEANHIDNITKAKLPDFVPLDSVANAEARMLAALEDDASYNDKGKLNEFAVIAAGLQISVNQGSDELGVVKGLLAEILAEKAELAAIPVGAADFAAQVQAKAKHLDPAKWIAGAAAVAAAKEPEAP